MYLIMCTQSLMLLIPFHTLYYSLPHSYHTPIVYTVFCILTMFKCLTEKNTHIMLIIINYVCRFCGEDAGKMEQQLHQEKTWRCCSVTYQDGVE